MRHREKMMDYDDIDIFAAHEHFETTIQLQAPVKQFVTAEFLLQEQWLMDLQGTVTKEEQKSCAAITMFLIETWT